MPEGGQDQGSIPVAVSVPPRCLDQLVDLGGRQVLALSIGRIGVPAR